MAVICSCCSREIPPSVAGEEYVCPKCGGDVNQSIGPVLEVRFFCGECNEEVHPIKLEDFKADRIMNMAASIIDDVEEMIRSEFPQIERIAKKREGNTLLHGDIYYQLEDGIREKLRELEN